MGIKKIVLITTGQPSTNPRIVKEADALQEAGFEVTVLYSYFIEWASKTDEELLKKVQWNYRLIGGSPIESKPLYDFTRIRFKLSRFLNKYFGNNLLLAERAQARAYDEIFREAKKIKADWYIGHNLGALAIAVNAATVNKAKSGFDFEDYHRGENDHIEATELKRIIYLEEKYVPRLNYISAASPMIGQKIEEHFPDKKNLIITLLNCFPLCQQPAFREKANGDKTLQLFWFSQTIGFNRGLETIIDTMKQINDLNIHLTLAGRCNQDFNKYLEINAPELTENIHFSGIISPDELPAYAAKFDVGLALELLVPENRNICLTNKIFIYLLAGNAIIHSATKMQKKFNEKNKVGISFGVNSENELIRALLKYTDREFLENQRKQNYKLAQNIFNWEIESKKLISQISGLKSSANEL